MPKWIRWIKLYFSLYFLKWMIFFWATLIFSAQEFIFYTFIKQFAKSYSFSSAKNDSSLTCECIHLSSLRKEDKPNSRLRREQLQIS